MKIFIDTETTGIEEKDRIIQLSFLLKYDTGPINIYDDLCKPGAEINPGAMATHHITPEMIKGKPLLRDCEAFKTLNENNSPDNIIVIHNAPFDLDMLKKEGFENKMRIIDTLHIAKHLWPDIDSRSLQYLRYYFHLYQREKALLSGIGMTTGIIAHDAVGDVIALYQLYLYLREKFSDDDLLTLTRKPILLTKLNFGKKHYGKMIIDVVKGDPKYVAWMLKEATISEEMRYSLKYYKKEYWDDK